MIDIDYEAWLKGQNGGYCAEVKDIGNGMYAAAKPLLFHWTMIIGMIGDKAEILDHFCYANREQALEFLRKWDGTGEPMGWHRHPRSGRRRPGGDTTKEYHAD